MAVLIKTNGDVQRVTPKNGMEFTLEELQGFVGEYIEAVYAIQPGRFAHLGGDDDIQPGDVMFVNEDGKRKRLPFNETATKLYLHRQYDVIVGDVIICRPGKEVS